MVGGRIRDGLLGRPTADTDLIVPSGAIAAAHQVARLTGGRGVVLDQARDVARVVWAGQDASLDIAGWAADSLEADLRLRDYTVNAMACPLHTEPSAGSVIDPAGGLVDLSARRLCMVSSGALERDPLRLLRGVRLAVELDFHLDGDTEQAMRRHASLAGRPAAERITDELFRIIEHSDARRGVSMLDDIGIAAGIGLAPRGRAVWNGLTGLHKVLRQGERPSTPAPEEGIAAAPRSAAERARAEDGPPELLVWSALDGLFGQLLEHLGRRIAANRTIGGLVAFAALADDGDGRAADASYAPAVDHPTDNPDGPPAADRPTDNPEAPSAADRPTDNPDSPSAADRLADRFKLSRAERRRLNAIAAARGLWPTVVASCGGRVPVYRMFRAAGSAGVDAVLIELALWSGKGASPNAEAAATQAAAAAALRTWFFERSLAQPPLLVDGNELIQTLGIAPGRHAGEVLEAVREAQVEGRVADRSEALVEAAAAHARLSKAP